MIEMTQKLFTFLFLFLAGFSVNASISLPKLEPQVTINGQVATATLMFDSNVREELMERLALAKELFEKYKNDPCFRDEVNKKLGKEAADYFTDPDKISDLLITGGVGTLAGAGIGAASKSAKAEQMLQKLGKLLKKMGGKAGKVGVPKSNLPSTMRQTTQGEKFIRYESGHPRYTKVTPEGGLKPGTYTAPASEGVLSKSQISSRYNLPDPEIPRSVYYEVKPPASTWVEGPKPVMGGTGSEVVFPYGTPPGSVGPLTPVQ